MNPHPKTIRELIEALETGHKPVLKVIGFVWDEFELDEGCLLRITRFTGTEDGSHHFEYNFDEFKDYNRGLLKKVWRRRSSAGNYEEVTAEEYGAWQLPNVGLYLGDSSSDELSHYGLGPYSTKELRIVLEAEIERTKKLTVELEKQLADIPEEA